MSLIESILSAGGGGVAKQLASQFGVSGDQVGSLVSAAVPALAGGLQEKLSGEGGAGLTSLLTGGALNQFADNPASLATPAAAQQGEGILSQLFGSGDGVGSLVSSLAGSTGIGGSILQKMLPVVATMAMGFISKNIAGDPTKLTGLLGALTGGGGILGALKGAAGKLFG